MTTREITKNDLKIAGKNDQGRQTCDSLQSQNANKNNEKKTDVSS